MPTLPLRPRDPPLFSDRRCLPCAVFFGKYVRREGENWSNEAQCCITVCGLTDGPTACLGTCAGNTELIASSSHFLRSSPRRRYVSPSDKDKYSHKRQFPLRDINFCIISLKFSFSSLCQLLCGLHADSSCLVDASGHGLRSREQLVADRNSESRKLILADVPFSPVNIPNFNLILPYSLNIL